MKKINYENSSFNLKITDSKISAIRPGDIEKVKITNETVLVAVSESNSMSTYFPVLIDIKTLYVFDDINEAIGSWEEIIYNEGKWYWIFTSEKVICSGICDPSDIDILKEYGE